MSEVIHALQITDLHLKADSNALWRGHNVQQSLAAVLKLASEAPHWPPDLILVTGDIVDDETPDGYRQCYRQLAQQLRKMLGAAATTTKIAYLPGNHDAPEILAESCATLNIYGCGCFELGNWLFIQLDSTLPHDCDGELGDEQLGLLQTYLASSQQPNALIALHHPLVALGSKWIDTMRVKDAATFFRIIEDFNSNTRKTRRAVKVVIWGHAHQQTTLEKNGLSLLGTPAAGPVQFTVGSDDFSIDEALAPGLRWLLLNPDGRIQTQVERIK